MENAEAAALQRLSTFGSVHVIIISVDQQLKVTRISRSAGVQVASGIGIYVASTFPLMFFVFNHTT